MARRSELQAAFDDLACEVTTLTNDNHGLLKTQSVLQS